MPCQSPCPKQSERSAALMCESCRSPASGAAVQNGHFQVVDFHVGVVDAHGVEHAQQVLRGRDQDALAHQAGGIADARYMPPTGGDREAVEIGADENHAGGDRRRQNTNVHGHPGVQAYSRGLYRALDRGLKPQSVSPASGILITSSSERNYKYLMRKDLSKLHCG